MPTLKPRPYGIYYSPVAGPYRQADLEAYLPVLKILRAGWVVLRSTATRAVPEGFVHGLLQADTMPVVHLDAPLSIVPAEVRPILRAYARWGIRHVLLFDRPNRRAAWGAAWHQPDLPGRFLDAFIPLAEAAAEEGLQPFFPPLAPGGDYWDLAFLRASLEGLRRRNADLAKQIGIAAYAWSEGKPLTWGKGGPEVWPETQPYYTPPQSENHLGFRIFDWYAVEAKAALGRTPPIFLAGMGSRYEREPEEALLAKNTAIAQAFQAGELPEAVIGGAFYTLTAPPDHPHAAMAWVTPQGKRREVIDAIAQQASAAHSAKSDPKAAAAETPSPVKRYILLPREIGNTTPYLNAALPWMQAGAATAGFQVEDARDAGEIVVVGKPEDFPPETLTALLDLGRPMRWVPVAGMDVAQKG